MEKNLAMSRERNKLTIQVHEYQWHKNLLRNAKQKVFKTAKTIKHVMDEVGKGKRIWILGIGYSLEEWGMKLKKEIKNDDILFVLDASLRYVVNTLQLTPDYVFVLDSKKEGLRFFKDVDLSKLKIVVSSAIDKEFLPVVEQFKEVYGFHMYDPSLPDWGGNSDTVAHKMLPNLNYVLNKGNVFNLALQVAINCQPSEIIEVGSEYCYKFDKNGNLRTRASVNEENFTYEIGGNFCRYDKIITVENEKGEYILTQKDYFGYSQITKQILRETNIPFKSLSGGLL